MELETFLGRAQCYFVVKWKCYIFYRMTVLMQQPKTLRMEPLTEMETAFVGQWIITWICN